MPICSEWKILLCITSVKPRPPALILYYTVQSLIICYTVLGLRGLWDTEKERRRHKEGDREEGQQEQRKYCTRIGRTVEINRKFKTARTKVVGRKVGQLNHWKGAVGDRKGTKTFIVLPTTLRAIPPVGTAHITGGNKYPLGHWMGLWSCQYTRVYQLLQSTQRNHAASVNLWPSVLLHCLEESFNL